MAEQFRIGAATAEITPAPGSLMDGYMARVEGSTGTHDPLLAEALVLEYENRRAAIITLDVMGVSRSFTDALRYDLAALMGTAPDAILICASHTHAAPRGLQDWSPIGESSIGARGLDPQFASSVQAGIRQAVERAYGGLRPARMKSAAGEINGIGGERNHPEQAVDTRVSVMVFEDMQGEPLAILFHYACHPTVLSADNLQYSADFPGAARQSIRERYPNAVPLFVNGAAGNISTRFHRREQSFEEAARLGGLLGEKVLALVHEAAEDTPALGWLCEAVSLPLREFPTEAREAAPPSGNARIDTVRAQGAAIERGLRLALAGRETQTAELCALRVGKWTLLSVPGEAYNELAQTVRRADENALVAGYTNDYLGYFPTQAAIDDATYEALSSAFDARAHGNLGERLAGLAGRLG